MGKDELLQILHGVGNTGRLGTSWVRNLRVQPLREALHAVERTKQQLLRLGG